MPGSLLQLNVSNGGMPKLPVDSAHVSPGGVAGDRQINLKYHGGPDRAVCLFSDELYDDLREDGIDLPAGSVGENFTTSGIDLNSLTPGDRLRVGDSLIEITNVREPCSKLNKLHPQLLKKIAGRSGWVAKVVEQGIVRRGDGIEVLKVAL